MILQMYNHDIFTPQQDHLLFLLFINLPLGLNVLLIPRLYFPSPPDTTRRSPSSPPPIIARPDTLGSAWTMLHRHL
ncbi:hypothetical protein BJX96DRAFT_22051 [Aspergillus floccosus]